MRRDWPGRGTALAAPFTAGGAVDEPRVRQGWMRDVPGLRG